MEAKKIERVCRCPERRDIEEDLKNGNTDGAYGKLCCNRDHYSREYRKVLADAPDAAAQAAAELGLGQVTYLRKHFGEARGHFERARALYDSLGLTAEAEAARAAAADL